MAEVRLNSITKKFGDVKAVDNFNAVINDGEFVSMLGPSGCGKTTMLRMIAGFEKATEGDIYIGNTLVSSAHTSSRSSFVPPEKRGIGMVFQSYAVWPHMNVFDNVAYPLKIRKAPKQEIKEKTIKALEMVHLGDYIERYPNQLSGGQQQRVALSRALVNEPKLLLLDEPLSNLDAKLRESMRFEIKELQKKLKMTVIYVTHDQAEAMAMSDKIIVMNKGVIQQIDTPFNIYEKPANQIVTDFIGLVNFISADITSNEISLPSLQYKLNRNNSFEGKGIVAVRPENIKLSTDGIGLELKGKVVAKFYLGDSVDYRVEVKDEVIRVIDKADIDHQYDEGADVYLSFNKVMLFPNNGEK